MYSSKITSTLAQISHFRPLPAVSRNQYQTTEQSLQLATRSYTIPAGTPGSGVGKGGGAGGAIKESGGGLGKYGAAQEEGYFFNKDKRQLAKIKEKAKSEPEKAKEVTRSPNESID